ncbi:MAG: peptidylprolyl isomerase [Salibacteraceae bacterium]
MAVIGKIRSRSGLLIGIIGVAMVLFVGGDLMKGNSSLFSQPDTDVGEINGTKISYQEFDNRVSQAAANQNISGDQIDQLRNQIWNQLLQEQLVETQYAELGISVSDEELWEEIKSNPRNPILLQYFTNQQTGQVYEQLRDEATGGLSSQKVLYYVQQVLNSETPENWLPVEKAIKNTLLSTKYNDAIKKGLYVTAFDAEEKAKEDNNRVSLAFVSMKYDEVSDDEISFNDADLKSYYNSHKSEAEYEQKETNRGVKIISWNVNPSESDIRKAEQAAGDLIAPFKSAENDTLFLLQNSDDRNGFISVGRYEMPEEIDSILFNAENGTVMGPYSVGGAFRITKRIKSKMMADSVRARHILIQPSAELDTATAKARIDSLKNAIQNGAKFEDLATDFSADLGSAKNGGDLDWFVSGQMVPEFDNACFSGNVGDMPIVFTQFGYHLIEITDMTERKEKVEIVNITRTIEASDETFEKAYNKASEFSIQNGTLETFIVAAEENPELNVQSFDFVKEGDKTLGSIENPRSIIRWAYGAEVGQVSDVYEIGNQFIVASLSSIKNKGVLPFEEAKDRLEEEVKKEKKAEFILAKIGSTKGIEAIAKGLGKSVQTTSDVSFANFSIPQIGPESKVLGIAYGLNEGEESEVIKGDNGIYVIRVDRIANSDAGNLDLTKNQIARSIGTRVDYEVFEALRERGNVEDNRHKFY